MDLRAVLRPVGPLPPAVYWRRRLLLLGAVAVLLIVVVLLAGSVGGSGARPAAGPGHTPAPGHTTAPAQQSGTAGGHPAASPGHSAAGATTSPQPTTPPPCRLVDLAVEISADQLHYAVGQHPTFVVTVRNRGTVPCRVDVGSAARRVVVRSGNDRIWSSADCGPSGHTVAVFRPGQQVAYSTLWSGHRSAPGCAVAEESNPVALPGTYRAGARVGRAASDETLFEFTS